MAETTLTLDALKAAVAGSAAAFRCVTEYQPAGGPGDKVFPPTYEGGKYATEKRYIPDPEQPNEPAKARVADCVLLDSVQSQANRMELALLDAWEAGQIKLPVIVVDFNDDRLEKRLRVTSLDAPHRIADAILRDSYVVENGKRGKIFRSKKREEQSEYGMKLDNVALRNATALLEMCPTALVFGMWDSTGPKGGLGAKFQRALVSEIVGYDAVPGVKTSSRIDPLGVQKGDKDGPTTIYSANTALGWQLSSERDGKWVAPGGTEKIGEGKKAGKPSSINHSNIPPTINVRTDKNDNPIKDENGREIPMGGFTISKAMQATTLSLPALRRLHFPPNLGHSPETESERRAAHEANVAARTALAALALCAATLARESGCDLRSRCQLVATTPFEWEFLNKPGETDHVRFTLTADEAIKLLNDAVVDLLKRISGAWPKDPIKLTPSDELLELVLRSQRLATAGSGDAGDEGN